MIQKAEACELGNLSTTSKGRPHDNVWYRHSNFLGVRFRASMSCDFHGLCHGEKRKKKKNTHTNQKKRMGKVCARVFGEDERVRVIVLKSSSGKSLLSLRRPKNAALLTHLV